MILFPKEENYRGVLAGIRIIPMITIIVFLFVFIFIYLQGPLLSGILPSALLISRVGIPSE